MKRHWVDTTVAEAYEVVKDMESRWYLEIEIHDQWEPVVAIGPSPEGYVLTAPDRFNSLFELKSGRFHFTGTEPMRLAFG